MDYIESERYLSFFNPFIYIFIDVPLTLSFRVQPYQDHHNGDIDIDLQDSFICMGSLQMVLDPLGRVNGTGTVKLPIMIISGGEYKIVYHAEIVENAVHASKIGEGVFWCSEPILIKAI